MTLKVRVKPDKWGFIGMPPKRRYGEGVKDRSKGDEFTLDRKDQFSSKWMEPIGWTPDGKTPAGKRTTSQEKSDSDTPKEEADEAPKPRRGRPPNPRLVPLE